jgi:8-oxo-dGTP pyrophosphatase MutT (NUDIX family)
MKRDYYTIRVAVWLVLRKEEKVLLLRRYNTGYRDGEYTCISGHLEQGESIVDALIREAKEEAGIVVKKDAVHVVHTSHRLCEDGQPYIYVFCNADTWRGEPSNTEPKKCDHMGWFSVHDLPNNVLPQVKDALTAIDKGVHFEEIGW